MFSIERVIVMASETPVKAPVKTPTVEPDVNPGRRLHPDELCPSQKERVVRTVRRFIP